MRVRLQGSGIGRFAHAPAKATGAISDVSPRFAQRAAELDLAVRRGDLEALDRDVLVDPAPDEFGALDANELRLRSTDDRVAEHEALDDEIDRRLQCERLARLLLSLRLRGFAEHHADALDFRIYDMHAHAEELEQGWIEVHSLQRDIQPACRVYIAHARQSQRPRDRAFARCDLEFSSHDVLSDVQCRARARLRIQEPEHAEHEEQQNPADRTEGPMQPAPLHRSGPMTRCTRRPSSRSLTTGTARSSRTSPTGERQRRPSPAPTFASRSEEYASPASTKTAAPQFSRKYCSYSALSTVRYLSPMTPPSAFVSP